MIPLPSGPEPVGVVVWAGRSLEPFQAPAPAVCLIGCALATLAAEWGDEDEPPAVILRRKLDQARRRRRSRAREVAAAKVTAAPRFEVFSRPRPGRAARNAAIWALLATPRSTAELVAGVGARDYGPVSTLLSKAVRVGVVAVAGERVRSRRRAAKGPRVERLYTRAAAFADAPNFPKIGRLPALTKGLGPA